MPNPDFIQDQLSNNFPAIDKAQFAPRTYQPETCVFFGRDFDERINAIFRIGSHCASHNVQRAVFLIVRKDVVRRLDENKAVMKTHAELIGCPSFTS